MKLLLRSSERLSLFHYFSSQLCERRRQVGNKYRINFLLILKSTISLWFMARNVTVILLSCRLCKSLPQKGLFNFPKTNRFCAWGEIRQNYSIKPCFRTVRVNLPLVCASGSHLRFRNSEDWNLWNEKYPKIQMIPSSSTRITFNREVI